MNEWTTQIGFAILLAGPCLVAAGCSHQEPNGRSVTITPEDQDLLAELSQDLRKRPHDDVLRVRYAQALSRTGDYPAALSQLDVILQKGFHPQASLERGRTLIRAGKPDEARVELAGLLQRQRDIHAARLLLGYCCLDRRQYDEAEAAFTKVTQDDESVRRRVSAYLGLAFLYDRNGQKDRASKCYQEAIDLDESVAEVLIQVERHNFWPAPVADPRDRTGPRGTLSPGEIERIVEENRRYK